MRLVYDLRILEGRMHGMARYGLELLRALLAEEADLAVAVLVRRPADAGLLPADPRVVAVACDLKPYGLASQLGLPKVLARMRAELYFCPFYAPPRWCPLPMVLTIHDLIHLRFPADHGLRHRLFYRLVVGPAARRARLVFTVSRHSRDDLVELLGVDLARVALVPNGVGEAFRPLAAEARPAAAAALGLPPRYLLGVGNPRPHKNLVALVTAHALMKERGLAPPPLVLVGVGPGELAGIAPGPELILRSGLGDAELALAYGAAVAVAVPSLYEGFGLPALEALACGAPVVAADRASLPEVLGGAGLLCAPEPPALAAALGRVLEEPGLAARLAAAGPLQARRFTWAAAARAALAGFRRALGRD